jgi:threonine dehydratase
MLSLADVEAATEHTAETCRRTPLWRSNQFSRLTGAEVVLKLENRQRTGSFKLRGATNKIAHLTPGERDAGVVTASAGNHAQGVALAASRAGIDATIVMPTTAPKAKIAATRDYGGRVVLAGDDYDAARERAATIEDEEGRTYIPAYDDPLVIAGQGTLALEALEQGETEPDLVLVPIGGGGLIAGIATVVTATTDARVVGVEAELAAKAGRSLAEGRRVSTETGMTIADGIATGSIGERPFAVMQERVDEVVSVSEAGIAQAIALAAEREKTVVEGAGAAPLAALLEERVSIAPDDRVLVPLCGGNIDLLQLASVLTTGLRELGRYGTLTVTAEDSPGRLARILQIVADHGANVYSVEHDRLGRGEGLRSTTVEIEIEAEDAERIAAIRSALAEAGFTLHGAASTDTESE